MFVLDLITHSKKLIEKVRSFKSFINGFIPYILFPPISAKTKYVAPEMLNYKNIEEQDTRHRHIFLENSWNKLIAIGIRLFHI